MAEVLGVVASGVSVGSLAIQILGSLRQIFELYSSVTYAGSDVCQIFQELQIFAEFLSNQDGYEYEESHGLYSSPATCKALKFCQNAAENVAAVVDDLKDSLDAGKARQIWTAVRAVLKEKRLNKCLSRLERAKSMLFFAQQSYLLANQRYTQ